MAEEVEVFLKVGFGVGVVGAEAVAGEVSLGGGVEGGGEGIGPGVSTGVVGAPAAGVHPLGAIPGRIDVDRKEQRFGYAVLTGNPVETVHEHPDGIGVKDIEVQTVPTGPLLWQGGLKKASF